MPCRPWPALLALLVVSWLPVTAAHASTFTPILVDGDVADWASVPLTHQDPSGDHGDAPVDIGRIHIANDDRFFYLRIEIGVLLNLQNLPAPFHIHLDTDHSIATGYPIEGIGSDLVVDCSGGGYGVNIYEQTAQGFFALDLGHGIFEAYQGPTVAAIEFELRLLRDTALPLHGTIAFPGPEVRVALTALDAGGAIADVAPDTPGSLTYSLAGGTPVPPPDNDLAREVAEHVRLLSYNTHNGDLFGAQAPRVTRILQAIEPDVIGFQELWDYTPAQIVARLDQDLPLPGGAVWVAYKGNRGQITASRYPMQHDPASPWGELTTYINLPDDEYEHDLYLFNSHFKCCGSIGTVEDGQRQAAADGIIAWIRDLQTAGGAELPAGTPIALLGDLNLVGGPRPLTTLITGDIVNEGSFGPDHPPDWDGSDWDRAAPLHTDGLAAYTWRNDNSAYMPGKLDYLFYTGSVSTAGNRFVLNTLDMTPAKLALLGLEQNDTRYASDHLPAVLDLAIAADTAVAGGESPPVPAGGFAASPNPLFSSTRLDFELTGAGTIEIDIHDSAGRLVRRLNPGWRWGGPQSVRWNGRDAAGHAVVSGIYFAYLRPTGAGLAHGERTLKLTVLR